MGNEWREKERHALFVLYCPSLLTFAVVYFLGYVSLLVVVRDSFSFHSLSNHFLYSRPSFCLSILSGQKYLHSSTTSSTLFVCLMFRIYLCISCTVCM